SAELHGHLGGHRPDVGRSPHPVRTEEPRLRLRLRKPHQPHFARPSRRPSHRPGSTPMLGTRTPVSKARAVAEGGYHSSSVERSPASLPSSCALSSRRTIFPLRVFGNLSTTLMALGVAMGPSSWRT